MSFFRNGGGIASASLSVYDASGGAVKAPGRFVGLDRQEGPPGIGRRIFGEGRD